MKRTEDGGVAVLSVMSMLTLALALIIALEFACLYAQKSAYDNDLNIAREETFSAGFDMQLKNSDDPGALICSKLVQSLRSNGYQGGITLWFYEATEEEIEDANPEIDSAQNVRSLAYQVLLNQDYEATIAPASWLADLVIANGTTASLCPYALHRTYKPDDIAGVLWRYEVPANSTTSSKQSRPLADATPGMTQAIEEALEKPTEIARANQ